MTLFGLSEEEVQGVHQSAVISGDGLYRYLLGRWWDAAKAPMTFVMLNPSTADASINDPTIRRCMAFARREGCGGIQVINLYALRATNPAHLLDHPDPEGPQNAQYWGVLGANPGIVVAAWGASVRPVEKKGVFSHALVNADKTGWKCLGKTADGSPRHPLYVRADQELVAL